MQRGEGTEQQVTWEDQQNINTFNRLNNRLHELEDDVKAEKALLENLEDASNEVMLADDDEPIRVKVGDVFFHMEKDDVEPVLLKETEVEEAELKSLVNESSEITRKMGELKDALYGKFGRDSINLEED
eukprot:TRINITY_DN18677_c0_g1_i1.p1 TRINITY_DN18677_c0_g1~~TRINITY_DN18677_c0_g1_i1.p1  ORF type:complete len:129 (+),score=37.32 TRINITY_DN18677_c0_g1_i1:248-634(+)